MMAMTNRRAGGLNDPRVLALREQVQRFRSGTGVELRPSSAYEALTRQKVEALADELREIKSRLNGLLWMLAGTILLDVLMRLVRI